MTLDDLFAMLSYGELSNHHMSVDLPGTIAAEKKPQIVQFANEALLRLHTKFILSERFLILELSEGETEYHLKSAYATQSFDPNIAQVPYIKDTPEHKFVDDVIRVLSVQNNWGQERPLNNTENFLSCFTPSSLVLQVPAPKTYEVLSVSYQAKHSKLLYTSAGNSVITLTDSLHGALTAFIAYKVYHSMNTAETMAIAQGHLQMFDHICGESVESDVLNTSISETNTRFFQRGWI